MTQTLYAHMNIIKEERKKEISIKEQALWTSSSHHCTGE
jgi:hypothetical protein